MQDKRKGGLYQKNRPNNSLSIGSLNMNDYSKLAQALCACGCSEPSSTQTGMVHRVPEQGKPRSNKNCWYSIALTGLWFSGGNWRTGETFSAPFEECSQLSDIDRLELDRQRKAEQAKRNAEIKVKQTQAAIEANIKFAKARKADPEHSYLVRKKISPRGLKQAGNTLLIPIYNFDRELVNLQYITPEGKKRFHPRGRVKGCFSPIKGGE